MQAEITQPQTATLLNEGKTKRVLAVPDDLKTVILESKDDITAGDGAKHDVIQGKAALSTRTAANVFRLLKAAGIPVAFIEQTGETTFSAPRCEMIPLEVIVRREAHGSYLKRNPNLRKGHIFPKLVLEFFLKTSDKKWGSMSIPKDDPLIVFEGESHWMQLYLPDQPVWSQQNFAVLRDWPLKCRPEQLDEMGDIAKKTFLVLEKAWQLAGRRLVDFKVEFGIDTNGALLLADVIDNDSWRVVNDGGNYIDKQVYRDGGSLDKVTANLRHVADLTGRFEIPKQQVILWRASNSDDLKPFDDALKQYGFNGVIQVFTRSLHKQPVQACLELAQAVQDIPDSVVIAFVGRSNGAGPTLSGQTTVPVITVPASAKEFPEDLWSSLRTPSDIPVATVMDPKNAVLAALQILAMRNPRLYAELRSRQEERLTNVAPL